MMITTRLADAAGNLVECIASLPAHASSVAIFSHGFSSSKASKLYRDLEKTLNDEQIGTVRYDYYGHGPAYGHHGPGYGVSPDVTLSKAVASLRAVIDYVRDSHPRQIGLVGSSFGGLVSLVGAAQIVGINALALKSPVTEPIGFWKMRLGKERIDRWKQDGTMHYSFGDEDYDLDYAFWEDLASYKMSALLPSINCPTLIVHGGADVIVPLEQSRSLAAALKTEMRVVDGAGHDYAGPGQYETVRGLLVDFLIEKLTDRSK